MAYLTPTESLNCLHNISRKKLYEMMQNGSLSYIVRDKKRLIETSELIRIFGSDFTMTETNLKQNETLETELSATKYAQINAELSAAKQLITELKIDKEDYKIRLDKAQNIIEQQLLLLNDLREKTSPNLENNANNKLKWWQFSRKNHE
jgi:hypothetical protein